MEEKKALSKNIKHTAKKYLKWYLYPLIYFLVTTGVCLYAWYGPRVYPEAAVRIIFKTIALIPFLIGASVITSWIIAVSLFAVVSFHFKQKFPDAYLWRVIDRFSFQRISQEEEMFAPDAQKARQSPGRRIVGSFIHVTGFVLVLAGMTLIVWISRPYITLLLSTSKVVELQQRVEQGQIHDNRVIIPSILVDAPILEGIDSGKLSRGVCHLSNSSVPGEGRNVILEGHNLAEFGLWKPQSFFSLLELVDKETLIYVFYNGKKYVYRVKEKRYLNVGDPQLSDSSPGERLTLITCVSTWSPSVYTNRRTVVTANPEF
ncbi:MAG: sortase [Nitrospirota bacterium]